ncbi:uncharacterized protein LOC122287689 [Carya illinoinensis]|uniref:uncharacterized protein LOC122287689 n=1 Tax=Carya illinoinensis TaxID=32201 RepID=UPI001C722D43|nr:uncharacterized protein LOC122287689 [Carya illinoinensis]
MYFVFSKAEVQSSAEPFRFSVVLKFLRRRPSLDQIRSFIQNRWGLRAVPVIGQLRNPRNVLVRLVMEEDFISVMARGNSEVLGVPYRIFHWSPDFIEEEDSPWVPVWVSLPGLPPNFFQESILRSIGDGIGKFLKRDNATACVTCPEATRICVEVNVAGSLRKSFWLGAPHGETSHFQEIFYESVPSFCCSCRKQGHTEDKCNRIRMSKRKKEVQGGGGQVTFGKVVWKEIVSDGKKSAQNNRQVEKGQCSMSRRQVILEKISERQKEKVEENVPIIFISPLGIGFDRVEEQVLVTDITKVQQMGSDSYVEPQVERRADGCIREKGLEQEGVLEILLPIHSPYRSPAKWSDVEDDKSSDSGLEALHSSNTSAPRSILRMIDESLEFELGGMDRDGDFLVSERLEPRDYGRAGSEGDQDDELNELAVKAFESDPDMHVPLKKVKGLRKEKSVVALERRTRSKKFL